MQIISGAAGEAHVQKKKCIANKHFDVVKIDRGMQALLPSFTVGAQSIS